MTDVVAVFLDMFGWSYDMITIADVINNIVRLAIGIGVPLFVFFFFFFFFVLLNRLL